MALNFGVANPSQFLALQTPLSVRVFTLLSIRVLKVEFTLLTSFMQSIGVYGVYRVYGVYEEASKDVRGSQKRPLIVSDTDWRSRTIKFLSISSLEASGGRSQLVSTKLLSICAEVGLLNSGPQFDSGMLLSIQSLGSVLNSGSQFDSGILLSIQSLVTVLNSGSQFDSGMLLSIVTLNSVWGISSQLPLSIRVCSEGLNSRFGVGAQFVAALLIFLFTPLLSPRTQIQSRRRVLNFCNLLSITNSRIAFNFSEGCIFRVCSQRPLNVQS
jgi:hypothetical protein